MARKSWLTQVLPETKRKAVKLRSFIGTWSFRCTLPPEIISLLNY